MRILLDLTRTENSGLEGTVSLEGSNERASFSGWYELLALLERMGPPAKTKSNPASKAQGTGEVDPWL
jgi:hypothetical protein